MHHEHEEDMLVGQHVGHYISRRNSASSVDGLSQAYSEHFDSESNVSSDCERNYREGATVSTFQVDLDCKITKSQSEDNESTNSEQTIDNESVASDDLEATLYGDNIDVSMDNTSTDKVRTMYYSDEEESSAGEGDSKPHDLILVSSSSPYGRMLEQQRKSMAISDSYPNSPLQSMSSSIPATPVLHTPGKNIFVNGLQSDNKSKATPTQFTPRTAGFDEDGGDTWISKPSIQKSDGDLGEISNITSPINFAIASDSRDHMRAARDDMPTSSPFDEASSSHSSPPLPFPHSNYSKSRNSSNSPLPGKSEGHISHSNLIRDDSKEYIVKSPDIDNSSARLRSLRTSINYDVNASPVPKSESCAVSLVDDDITNGMTTPSVKNSEPDSVSLPFPSPASTSKYRAVPRNVTTALHRVAVNNAALVASRDSPNRRNSSDSLRIEVSGSASTDAIDSPSFQTPTQNDISSAHNLIGSNNVFESKALFRENELSDQLSTSNDKHLNVSELSPSGSDNDSPSISPLYSATSDQGIISDESPTASQELPNNWVEYLTDEGYTYYYNHVTGESTWEFPVENESAQHAISAIESITVSYNNEPILQDNIEEIKNESIAAQSSETLLHQNKNGQTALHISASQCNSQALYLLLSTGTNPDILDGNGWSPLQLVCQVEPSPEQVACIQHLLAYNANCNIIDQNSANSPLHLLLLWGTGCYLLSQCPYNNFLSPEAASLSKEELEQIRHFQLCSVSAILEDKQLDLSLENADGDQALHIAVKLGLLDCMQAMLNSQGRLVHANNPKMHEMDKLPSLNTAEEVLIVAGSKTPDSHSVASVHSVGSVSNSSRRRRHKTSRNIRKSRSSNQQWDNLAHHADGLSLRTTVYSSSSEDDSRGPERDSVSSRHSHHHRQKQHSIRLRQESKDTSVEDLASDIPLSNAEVKLEEALDAKTNDNGLVDMRESHEELPLQLAVKTSQPPTQDIALALIEDKMNKYEIENEDFNSTFQVLTSSDYVEALDSGTPQPSLQPHQDQLEERNCCFEDHEAKVEHNEDEDPDFHDDDIEGLGVLRDGWVEYCTEDGDTYYYNANNGHVQWKHPFQLELDRKASRLEARRLEKQKESGHAHIVIKEETSGVTAEKPAVIESTQYNEGGMDNQGVFGNSSAEKCGMRTLSVEASHGSVVHSAPNNLELSRNEAAIIYPESKIMPFNTSQNHDQSSRVSQENYSNRVNRAPSVSSLSDVTSDSIRTNMSSEKHLEVWSKFFENAMIASSSGHAPGDDKRADRKPFMSVGGFTPNSSRRKLRVPTRADWALPPRTSDFRKLVNETFELKSAFDAANEMGQSNKTLGRKVAAVSCKAMLAASMRGDVDTLEELLLSGFSPSCVDEQIRSPLHHACRAGDVLMVELLNDYGVDLDATDISGQTPLHVACMFGRSDVIHCLLKCAVDTDIQNNHGDSALHIIARKGDIEICRSLLEYGASVDTQNIDGRTPLDVAVHELSGHRGSKPPLGVRQVVAALTTAHATSFNVKLSASSPTSSNLETSQFGRDVHKQEEIDREVKNALLNSNVDEEYSVTSSAADNASLLKYQVDDNISSRNSDLSSVGVVPRIRRKKKQGSGSSRADPGGRVNELMDRARSARFSAAGRRGDAADSFAVTEADERKQQGRLSQYRAEYSSSVYGDVSAAISDDSSNENIDGDIYLPHHNHRNSINDFNHIPDFVHQKTSHFESSSRQALQNENIDNDDDDKDDDDEDDDDEDDDKSSSSFGTGVLWGAATSLLSATMQMLSSSKNSTEQEPTEPQPSQATRPPTDSELFHRGIGFQFDSGTVPQSPRPPRIVEDDIRAAARSGHTPRRSGPPSAPDEVVVAVEMARAAERHRRTPKHNQLPNHVPKPAPLNVKETRGSFAVKQNSYSMVKNGFMPTTVASRYVDVFNGPDSKL